MCQTGGVRVETRSVHVLREWVESGGRVRGWTPGSGAGLAQLNTGQGSSPSSPRRGPRSTDGVCGGVPAPTPSLVSSAWKVCTSLSTDCPPHSSVGSKTSSTLRLPSAGRSGSESPEGDSEGGVRHDPFVGGCTPLVPTDPPSWSSWRTDAPVPV